MLKKKVNQNVIIKAKEDAEFEASLDASLGKLDNLLPPEERARLSKLPKAPSGPGNDDCYSNRTLGITISINYITRWQSHYSSRYDIINKLFKYNLIFKMKNSIWKNSVLKYQKVLSILIFLIL
jgi:hypothetical protein